MDLVLFGMQGSGKGTQSQFIAKTCDFEIFEAGGALRRLATEDSDLGRKIKEIMEAGHFVPTEVVMEIITDFLHKLPEGKTVLFDGFPRSQDQQEQFDELMTAEGRNFKGVLIEISEEEALKRLTSRRVCLDCKAVYPAFYDKDACEKCGGKLVTRKDDTPAAIRTRLDNFLEKTVPVINDYDGRGMLIRVNGEQGINEVTQETLTALTPHFPTCL